MGFSAEGKRGQMEKWMVIGRDRGRKRWREGGRKEESEGGKDIRRKGREVGRCGGRERQQV